jgi:hypothetical protein
MLNKLIISHRRLILSKIVSKLFSAQEPKIAKVAEDSNKTNIDNLNKLISESFRKETDNYYPVDENQLKSILNSKGLSFINEENSKVIKLEKKVEDKLIRVIITPKQPDFAESEGENEGKFI